MKYLRKINEDNDAYNMAQSFGMGDPYEEVTGYDSHWNGANDEGAVETALINAEYYGEIIERKSGQTVVKCTGQADETESDLVYHLDDGSKIDLEVTQMVGETVFKLQLEKDGANKNVQDKWTEDDSMEKAIGSLFVKKTSKYVIDLPQDKGELTFNSREEAQQWIDSLNIRQAMNENYIVEQSKLNRKPFNSNFAVKAAQIAAYINNQIQELAKDLAVEKHMNDPKNYPTEEVGDIDRSRALQLIFHSDWKNKIIQGQGDSFVIDVRQKAEKKDNRTRKNNHSIILNTKDTGFVEPEKESDFGD